MEERLMDDPRKIKVKRNGVGGIADATDELAPDSEDETFEEAEFILPEGELDEDLIGLAPSELEKELARRKKEAEEAEAERDNLLSEGEALLNQKKYVEAEPFFSQALTYDPDCARAKQALWLCRTENFGNAEAIMDRDLAEEFRDSDDETKEYVRGKLAAKWREERASLEEEAAPLREKVRGAQKERRGAFLANRNYYRWRLLTFGALFCVFIVAMSIFGSYIVHVRSNTPVILTIVFGGLALLDLLPIILFARKFVVAQRLVSDNEKLSSTEDGQRLEELENRLELISVYLGEDET